MKKPNKQNFIWKIVAIIATILSFCFVSLSITTLNTDNTNNIASNSINSKSPNKQNASKLLVIGGSTTLVGFYGRNGQDSKKWYAFFNGINVSDKCSKSITTSSPNIFFNESEGLVYWNEKLEKGKYSIQIKYEYNDQTFNETYTTIINIELNIVDVFETSGGNTILSGTWGISGYDSNVWKTRYLNEDVTLSTKYTLINAPTEVLIGANGQITWNENIKVNTYTFKVRAVYTVDDQTFESTTPDIVLTINHNFKFSNGSTYLECKQKQSGTDKNNWIVTFDDTDVTKNIQFSFIDAPNGVTIDNEGYVSWNDSIPLGQYTFNLKATYINSNGTFETISPYITLKISQNFFVTGGSLNLYASTNQKSQDFKRWNAIYCNQLISSGIEWSVISTGNKFKINDGYVYWDNDLEEGTWNIVVQARITLNNTIITAQSPLIKVYVDNSQAEIDAKNNLIIICSCIGVVVLAAIIVPISVVFSRKKKR